MVLITVPLSPTIRALGIIAYLELAGGAPVQCPLYVGAVELELFIDILNISIIDSIPVTKWYSLSYSLSSLCSLIEVLC